MLERELMPRQVDKLEVIRFRAIDGSSVYLDQHTGVLSSKPGRMTDILGGIICEDMVNKHKRIIHKRKVPMYYITYIRALERPAFAWLL